MKINIKIIRVLLLMAIMLLLQSCTRPSTIQLYNNTQSDIIIEQYERHKKPEDRLTYFVKKGEAVVFDLIVASYKVYAVSSDSKGGSLNSENDLDKAFVDLVWDYEFIPPQLFMDFGDKSSEYVEYGSFSMVSGRIYGQIEEDGKIYLLKINMKPPVKKFPEQFGDYPLSPTKTKKFDPPIEKIY